jgi:CheY-like chemotaxis protein
MNIWLIDDDDITNMLHQFFLEEYFPDASIVVFSQAELALAALAENQAFPDHIFLDLNMPVMDGWEFLDAYSEMTIPNSNNIHIHILTSSLDPNDFAKAEQSPFVHGIISKPLEIEKVQFLKN